MRLNCKWFSEWQTRREGATINKLGCKINTFKTKYDSIYLHCWLHEPILSLLCTLEIWYLSLLKVIHFLEKAVVVSTIGPHRYMQYLRKKKDIIAMV
jgi:hypothetical protein